MRLYLINYAVEGIKTLDHRVSLSFYKKTISSNLDIQNYNIKGIYGMNGSGKSGIISSVDILKNLLINPEYLNNPIVQNNLDEIINKKIKRLSIEAEFIVDYHPTMIYRYSITLKKDTTEKYEISYEELTVRRTRATVNPTETIFKIENGEVQQIKRNGEDAILDKMLLKTTNLLSRNPICTLFPKTVLGELVNEFKNDNRQKLGDLFSGLVLLGVFGSRLHASLNDMIGFWDKIDNDYLNIISVSGNSVSKKAYSIYEDTVANLCEFLQIFKPDLKDIEIDKKENGDWYVCNLIMVYDDFKIHSEFESTGIKKLIKLFAYLREMVQGGIVFIDELDSNLHDVYLCALLEYLMEYGKGQLCFTTHNVGPMDVLKHHKKSIEFLSANHKIYSWTTSGNYSPSKLYKNGMIEGSPFNIDFTDFIGILDSGEGND